MVSRLEYFLAEWKGIVRLYSIDLLNSREKLELLLEFHNQRNIDDK